MVASKNCETALLHLIKITGDNDAYEIQTRRSNNRNYYGSNSTVAATTSRSTTSSTTGATEPTVELEEEYRLLHDNVPVGDKFYRDILYNVQTKQVVGLLRTLPSSTTTNSQSGTTTAKAQVLVNANGTPCSKPLKLVTVSIPETTTTTQTPAQQQQSSSSSSSNRNNSNSILVDFDIQPVLKYSIAVIILVAMLWFVLQHPVLLVLFWCLLASFTLYLYLALTCPLDTSFCVEQELRAVRQRTHSTQQSTTTTTTRRTLGRLYQSITKAVNVVTTSLVEWRIKIIHVLGAAKVACVHVPRDQRIYYWLGVSHQWIYFYCEELPQEGTLLIV